MYAVNSVIIVGGGSAGWLTALTLTTHCPFLRIRLVQPRNNEPIGVGESTQPDIARILTRAGIDLEEFVHACDATMKCGIYYQDWNGPGEDYWHPFTNLSTTGSYTAAHHYQQLIMADPGGYRHEDYYTAVHPSWDVCVNHGRIDPDAAAAFHVDAGRLTSFLRDRLPSVEVVEMDDIQVVTEDSRVAGITGDGGSRRLSADLYVDCTGFNRAVLGKVSTLESVDYVENVDRAVVAQIPYEDREAEVRPYTRARAHHHGWTWTIPLQSRMGSGYVYNSLFCSPEEAEREFREYWGCERMADLRTRHIAFNSKTLKHPWESNVVAIGLSSGFVEPLEATSLNWIITSADLLSQMLRVRYYDEDTIIKYNVDMAGYVKDVQDFIDAHYILSARRDSEFWRYHTSREHHPRMDMRLDLYRREMPNDYNRLKNSPWAFNEISWIDVLNGYRFQYQRVTPDAQQKQDAIKELKRVEAMHGPRAARCKHPLEYIRAAGR